MASKRRAFPILLLLLTPVALSAGCESHAGTGALLGGAGGAAIGGLIGSAADGHAAEGALIGGAIGAVGGYAIGNEQDKREERDRYYSRHYHPHYDHHHHPHSRRHYYEERHYYESPPAYDRRGYEYHRYSY